MPFAHTRFHRDNSRPSSLPMAFEQMTFSDDTINDGDISQFFDLPATPQSRNAISLSGTISQSNSDDEDDQPSNWLRTNDDSILSHPPIGVFWDIENCQVPKGKSAVAVAQVIRTNFFDNYREAEFVVVCDVKKENNQILQELNDAQVNLIHVASTYKNACDEKLRQSIRRFADTHGSPSAIILISGDINFAADLSDLRHRKKIHVILLHKTNCSQALIMCASEHHDFLELVEDLPPRPTLRPCLPVDLLISCLPEDKDPSKVKSRLRQISDNCGGRVVSINKSLALVRFQSEGAADRAQKRMDGEDVYGHRINVGYANRTPRRNIIRSNLSRNSGIPSAFIPHQLNFNHFPNSPSSLMSSPSGISSDASAPPPALMLPPPPSLFLHCTSSNSGEIVKSQNEIRPRVIRGRNELRGSLYDESENYTISSIEKQLPPLSQLLCASKKNFTQANVSPFNKTKHAFKGNFKPEQEALSPLLRQKFDILPRLNLEILPDKCDQNFIKFHLASLLLEVPDHSLPLHIFLKNLKKRCLINLEYENLANFSDVILISNDEVNGKIVVLNPRYRHTNVEKENGSCDRKNESQVLVPDLCSFHSNYQTLNILLDTLELNSLSKIKVRLKSFTQHLYKVLHSHNGFLPLKSFSRCYVAEIHKPIIKNDNGIPLEYVLNCLPNITIQYSTYLPNIKSIVWATSQDHFECDSLDLAEKLNSFCKEIFNIFHDLPKGQIHFNEFANYYFKIQGYLCQPRKYGYSNLATLLGSIPTVVKVIGEADDRLIILSYEGQIKRFVNHIVHLLDNQNLESISKSNLPKVYQQVFKKSWNITEYGVSSMDDLLCKIEDRSLKILKGFGGEIIFSSPKISHKKPLIEKINEFASQIVEILYHKPYCSLPFLEFPIYYEKHFGSKFRICDYGFNQLIDLINEIKHIVEIYEEKGHFMVRLIYIYRLQIFTEQLVILSDLYGQIPVKKLAEVYNTRFGFSLNFQTLNVKTINEAICLIPHQFQLINNEESQLSRIDIPFEHFQKKFILTLWKFLPQKRVIPIVEFTFAYWTRWQQLCTFSDIENNFKHLVNINKNLKKIEVSDIQILAWEIHQVLLFEHSFLPVHNFCKIYSKRFGRDCEPLEYGYTCIRDLLQAIPQTIQIIGKARLASIKVNPSFEDLELNHESTDLKSNNESKNLKSNNESKTNTSDETFQYFENNKPLFIRNVEENEHSAIQTCQIPQPPDPSQLPLPTKLQQTKSTSRMAANLFSEIAK